MPCKSPKTCGVMSHRPGTNAACLQPKAPTSRERALGLQPPVLAKSPSGYTDKEVQKADRALLEVQRDYWDTLPHEVEIKAKRAKQNEAILELAEDPRVVAVAKNGNYNVSEPGMSNVVMYDLQHRGFRNTKDNPDKLKLAIAATKQVGWREIDPEGTRKSRIQILSEDAYVREHVDAATQADLDEDFSANAEATQKLQHRLFNLGVPTKDIADLTEGVAERVRKHWQATAEFHASRNPAGTMPEWEPYTVEKGIQISQDRLARRSPGVASSKR